MDSLADSQAPALVVRARDGSSTNIELAQRPVVLGRAASCDVVLCNDGGVSREHAAVWLDATGRVLVADKGSKNGTRVDGGGLFRNGTRTALRSIRIGEHEIELVSLPRSDSDTDSQVCFAPEVPAPVGDTRVFPSSKRLDLNQQRLALLMGLTERIGGTFDRTQLLEQALDACCAALGFERGLILTKAVRGETELPVARNVQRDDTGAYKISRTLINQALVHGERAVVNNPATDLVDNLSESLVRFPICSALCVPILHRDEILGVVYGDRITQASTYTPEDVDFLAAIAQQVGVGLANLKLFQEYVRAQKMYLELEQARTIQRRLLPDRPLRCGRVHLAGYNQPSSAVGGDYFDHFELGGERVGLIIADVTGHGLPAALMMANLQAATRVALTADVPLADVADRLNRLVYRNTDADVFITAILGRIDTDTGVLEFIGAGHPGPILLGRRGVTHMETDNSLPFGVQADDDYRIQRIQPDQDLDAVLFFTDGLFEAEDPGGEMLGMPPLLAALSAVSDRSPGSVLRTTLDTVERHMADADALDDLTLLVVQPTS